MNFTPGPRLLIGHGRVSPAHSPPRSLQWSISADRQSASVARGFVRSKSNSGFDAASCAPMPLRRPRKSTAASSETSAVSSWSQRFSRDDDAKRISSCLEIVPWRLIQSDLVAAECNRYGADSARRNLLRFKHLPCALADTSENLSKCQLSVAGRVIAARVAADSDDLQQLLVPELPTCLDLGDPEVPTAVRIGQNVPQKHRYGDDSRPFDSECPCRRTLQDSGL